MSDVLYKPVGLFSLPFVFDFTLFRDSARHSGSCWETELKGDTKPGRKKNKSDQGKIQILKHPGGASRHEQRRWNQSYIREN